VHNARGQTIWTAQVCQVTFSYIGYKCTRTNRHILRLVSYRTQDNIKMINKNTKKMINNMEGKTYEERLDCLKLWTLEERRNRWDLIEVFKMCRRWQIF